MQIKHKYTGKVLFELECENIKTLVEEAVKAKVGLIGANLRYIDLEGADLEGVNFKDANLKDADLRGTNLKDAILTGANLADVDLMGANLKNANLTDANLEGADLIGANLEDVRVWNTIGNMREVRSMQIETYTITFTKDLLHIGCIGFPIEKWKNMSDEDVSRLSYKALKLWHKWKDFIFTAIDLSFPTD